MEKNIIFQDKKRKIRPMYIGPRKIVNRQPVPASIMMIELTKLAIARASKRKR